MKLVVKNVRALVSTLKVICKLTPEVRIRASKRGLEIFGAAQDHLVFVHGVMRAPFFEKYECSQSDETTICLEPHAVENVISRILASDRIQIEISSTTLLAKLNKPYERRFSLKGKQQWEAPPKFREFKYDIEYSIDPRVFREIITDATKTGDELSIQVFKNRLLFKAEGPFCEFVHEQEMNNEVIEHFSNTIMTSLLFLITPLIRECESVFLKIGNDKPLSLGLILDPRYASVQLIFSTRS